MYRERQYEELDEDGEGIDFRAIALTLLRRWRLIAAVSLATCLTSAIILLLIPNTYTASVQVRIETHTKPIVEIETVVPELKGDTQTIESEIEVIKSRTILEQVIDVLNLRADQEFAARTFYGNLTAKTPGARAPL